ncbi:hypothetical protein NBT05_06835 [Aquimarina sp. ERC-38]|uniref:hypothetical protein n=1 Tax=Aquimarina sp. ERC-38 TaxID=2949996 RepID=UPI0022467AD0|nr:hypothetical protein [Aquimarina sp. ERC-38]UZO82183.1 hypothetical protein NBT05_06835 [Aquimarina sp. ERC-38]
MSTDYKSESFRKLLDKLQQESWQLELLVSGFVIFGLFAAVDKLQEPINRTSIEGQVLISIFMITLLVSCYSIILNLILHLILRGLWIGALGLRYVSGDIDFEVLNYNKKFTKYLKKRIVSFDKYLATLENTCSVLFAISFLLVFYLISFFIISLLFAAITFFVFKNDSFSELTQQFLGYSLLILLAIGVLFTFLDSLTVGYFKRNRYIAKIYYPIYYIFSFITLSFLYRSIVHNFIDNKFGKKIFKLLIPVYIIILFITNIEYQVSNYIGTNSFKRINMDIVMSRNSYENNLEDNKDLVKVTSIPSKIINSNYLNLFHTYNGKTEDHIFAYDSTMLPKKDERGYFLGLFRLGEDTDSIIKVKKEKARQYLCTFNQSHQILIDTISFPSDFLISYNKKEQLGFETVLNLKNLSEGKHILYLKRLERNNQDSLITKEVSTIPFWYYK